MFEIGSVPIWPLNEHFIVEGLSGNSGKYIYYSYRYGTISSGVIKCRLKHKHSLFTIPLTIWYIRKPAHNISLYGQFHAEWREVLIPEAQRIRNSYLIGCGSCYIDLSNSSLSYTKQTKLLQLPSTELCSSFWHYSRYFNAVVHYTRAGVGTIHHFNTPNIDTVKYLCFKAFSRTK